MTYAFPDPLVTTYRHSVTHLSLISILDGDGAKLVSTRGAQSAYEQHGTLWKSERCRADSVQLQGDKCNVEWEGKREGPIEMYPKFWNLNPLTADGREVLRIPAWKECFALVKRELEAIMEKEILPATMPEFPIVRRMTLGNEQSPW